MIVITPNKIYEWLGRLILWGGLTFFTIYNAYDIGYSDGNTNGYIRGYVDAKFNLRPADPNLSREERERRQSSPPPTFPFPPKIPQKGSGVFSVKSDSYKIEGGNCHAQGKSNFWISSRSGRGCIVGLSKE